MVNINRLTFFTFQINSLIDQGFHLDLDEAQKICETLSLFTQLEKKFPFDSTGLDLSIINEGERKEIQEEFQDISIAQRPSEYRIEKRGLCLLVAYAQEMIQRNIKGFSDPYIQIRKRKK